MKLGETEFYDIPQGHDDLTIKNLDPESEGIYSMKGIAINSSRKIPAGETQRIHTHHGSVKVTNLASPMLEVLIRIRKLRIGEEGTFDIPEGIDSATITNLDPNLEGYYSVKGDTLEIDERIPAAETHTIQTQKKAAIITNTGYPMLEVVLPHDSEES
ncbi:MAG TPA: hypothetical protein QF468_01850 [Nitrospinota bacterium]|jgi:hypothetical protein|nr:hypothetical protein [Nitrospinota bacterium]